MYVCVHASINRMESAVTAIANGDGMENALCIQNFIETESTPPYIENRSPSTNVYCVEGCLILFGCSCCLVNFPLFV